jgi:hypothetical protein
MVFVNASHLRRVGFVYRAKKQMCHLRTGLLLFFGVRELRLCGGNKIELKKCAVGKIKNTEGSAMSAGLLVVRFQYGLYVGHLSKWFVLVLMFTF